MPLVPSKRNQQFRIVREDAYGVLPSSPAWKKVQSAALALTPAVETEPFTASGDAVPSINAVNDDYAEGSFEGKGDYNFAVYPVASWLGDPTITTPGGGTNSRQHDFGWNGTDPVLKPSFALHQGTADYAEEALGVIFNGYELSGARDGMDFSGDLWGKVLTTDVQLGGTVNEVQTASVTGAPTGGTFTLAYKGRTTAPIPYNATAAAVQAALQALPTVGPGGVVCAGGPLPGTPVTVTFRGPHGGKDVPLLTANSGSLTGGTAPAVGVVATTPGADTVELIPAVPMFPLHFSLYLDNSWAALGTTKLTQTFEMGIAAGEHAARTRPINAAKDSDSYVETSDQEHEVTLNMAVDQQHKAVLAALKAGSQIFVRVEAVGPLIEGAINYRFRQDMCLFVTEAGEGTDYEEVYVREFTCQVGKDQVSGNAVAVRVVNTRQSL
jgi:hypothetical protein